MKIHPSFDPVAGEWFTEDGRCAPTLALLARLVGGARRIEGYYPGGFGIRYSAGREHLARARVITLKTVNQRIADLRMMKRERVVEGVVINELVPLLREKPIVAVAVGTSKRVKSVSANGRYYVTKSERNEEILNLWAAGNTAPVIGKALGMRWKYVSHLIWMFRQNGEPRAVVRGKGWARNLGRDLTNNCLLSGNAR